MTKNKKKHIIYFMNKAGKINKIIETIYKNFKVGEPIFPSEIIGLFNLSRQRIYLYLREGILTGQLKKEKDYYYIPKYETLYGIKIDNKPTYEAVVKKKYLGDDNNVMGVYSGRTLENKLNISEQVPFTEEIVSNRVKEPLKKTMINNVNVILRKPYTKITRENKKEYILLQLLTDIEQGMFEDKRDIIDIYIRASKISKEKVMQLSKKFPMKTRKRLLGVLNDKRRVYQIS